MKNNLKNICLAVVIAAVMSAVCVGVYATASDRVVQLKARYDELCSQYQRAVNDSKADLASKLAVEVQNAKRAYDRARRALTIADKDKKSVADVVNGVVQTAGEVFSNGGGSRVEGAAAGSGASLKAFDNMHISIEGKNYCGQYAMASVFNALGYGRSAQQIYKDTNPAGIFTAPSAIVEYFNLNGIGAYERYNAGVSDIAAKLDSGLPVVLLVSTDDGTPHWVTVYGYQTNSAGEISALKMRDSYWGTTSGHVMGIEEFKKRWASPLGGGALGKLAGYSNMMIDISGRKDPDKSPRAFNFNFNTASEDCIAGGINDVVTGAKNFRPSCFGGGIVKCVLGVPGTVCGIAGNGLTSLGKSMANWGKKEFKEVGTGKKIAGTLAVAGGYVAQGAGWLAEKAGNVMSSVANAAGNFVKKLGYVFR